MTTIASRTVTLSVTPMSPATHLDDEAVAYLVDHAMNRLQASMDSLIAQGMLSGSLIYQEHPPAVHLLWTIKVADSPAASPSLSRSLD
ncbi:hypothetical protein [Pseudomonas putida]|uniref:Uncharacterized protein n=1 Tax=Pseudomonas putida TaxID=303 RepID=A0A7V8EFQ9_PSEPU|nr:hypothetical protein [Pseudomonas putida]KAF0253995.1 hypothetical protein GN299_15090 [Pseudomonas putida]